MCCILPGTCRVKVFTSHYKWKIRLNLTSFKRCRSFSIKSVLCQKRRRSAKCSSGTWLSPENNVHNKEIMLRKIHQSKYKLLKYVLGKIKNPFDFLSNKKSSYSQFYFSILPNILQILSKLYVVLCAIKMLFTTNQTEKKIYMASSKLRNKEHVRTYIVTQN